MKLGKFIPLVCTLLGVANSDNNVDSDCDYYQFLEPNVDYYVLNPGYPKFYKGKNSCRWEAESNTRVELNCSSVEIPATSNRGKDRLIVTIGNGQSYELGATSSFAITSIGSYMEIRFESSEKTSGGKFKCTLRATKKECRCGWKNPSRIVGGNETGVNEYPMMAGLVDYNRKLLFCGATIITPRHVLTAAHCVTRYINDLGRLGIVVGEHDVTTGSDTNATEVLLVEKIIIHPDYAQDVNDVAVVKAKRSIKYSMRVGPVCMPFDFGMKNFVGDTLTAMGWGTTEFSGPKSDVLLKADLDVISNSECAKYYPKISSKQICTYDKGKDACQFDSGGPELWQDPYNNRLFLIGVISYGKTCADEFPGVAMRVSLYLDFIKNSTRGEEYCHVSY